MLWGGFMPFRKRVSLGFSLAVGCLLPMCYVAAKPTDFKLRSGEARPPVQSESGAFLIESGKYAAIDWEGFSIAADEHVQFQQFDGKSYVLNRVMGPEGSELLGRLSSNGAVYLINPNGVFIGSQALIETAGFIASTLDLLDGNVKDKALHFAGASDQSIVNEGVIRCADGDVFLIGRHVDNSGTIEALRQGLVSGCDVMISSTRAPHVHIRARGNIDPALLEKNPYAIAIRHSGVCKGQEAYLIADEGTSEVSGQVIAEKENGEGGVVHVLGTNIQLLDGARIDTSGAFGGGEVLIGGGFQGKDPDIKNAEHVFVSEDVEVKADALEEGDGGKVIFWGDKSMAYQGSASSRGGPQGGDGGLIEVSGKRLKFEGKASTAAPCGQTGMLLLDPTNVTITTADMGGSFSGCISGTNTFTPDGAATDTINAATLVGLLKRSLQCDDLNGGIWWWRYGSDHSFQRRELERC